MFLLYWLLFLCNLTYFCRGQSCTNTRTSSQFQVNKYITCNASATTPIVKKSRIDCTRACLQTAKCVALKYNKTSKVCSMCSDTNVKSQVPGTGQDATFYGIRQNIECGALTITTNVTKQLDIPCGIKIGNTIAFRGVFTATSGFILNVQVDASNYLLHFRPQYGQIGYVHKKNGMWPSGIVANLTSYPFKVGSQFLLNILAQGDGFSMFVDGKFVGSYPYYFPTTSARYLLLYGNVQLLQLSI